MIENALSNYESPSCVLLEASSLSEEAERWYAVSVRPRHEKFVARHLEGRGLNYFLPVYRSVLNLRDRLGVLQAPGVVRFVLFQGQPAQIPDSEIRALESSLAAGRELQPHPYLQAGARVRVKRGPLLGAEGIMIHRKQRFRLVLSVDLIKRSVMAEVDEGDVEAI